MASGPKLRAVDALSNPPLKLFVTYRLSALSARLNRQAVNLLKKTANLRLPEWRVLALLALHGEMSGSEITALVGFDPALVSRSFRSLEMRGILAVKRSTDDRRSTRMALTRAGYALHAKVLPVMQNRQRFLLASLTAEERVVFLRAVDKLQVAANATEFPESGE